MYSITELFIFSAVLSLVACVIGYKHGRKKGFDRGAIVGAKAALTSVLTQLKAQGLELKVIEGYACSCPECVAERAAKKP